MAIAEMTTAMQNALQAIDDYVPVNADDSLRLIAAKCRALITGYSARWTNSIYQPTSVEELVQSDLYNPETQRKSRSFTVAGVLDVKALANVRRVVFDHKSTSQDIADLNSPYWRQLVVESQPSLYMLLEWLNGRKVDEAVWDIMKKPQIKPKTLSKADRAGVVAKGTYFERKMSTETVAAMQTEERENLEMYEARLTHDCTVERPDHYFQRRPIPRLDGEIMEFAQEFWDNGQEILLARRHNRWPRNSGACMLYGSPCKFLGICSGHDTPESDHWQKKTQVHSELPQLEGDGRDVLTNSRVRCFQTCRRKHFYEYELGIERQDEEEREALVFGTIWHKALNAWWSTFISQESNHVHSHNGSPVNAIGTACDPSEAADAR